MQPLLSSREAREVDRWAIEDLCIPEMLLMEHAALGVVGAIESRFAGDLAATRGVVICGPGNNGGDGLAVARILHERGCKNLIVSLLANESQLSASAASQLKILGKLAIPWVKELSAEVLAAADWIVDGLFGTGLSRNVEGKAKETIETINTFAGKKWIVAVDIPSGLCGDTGIPLGVAVRASETITFGFLKRGLVTGQAADYVGRLHLAHIQIPRQPRLTVDCLFYDGNDAARIPPRKKTTHKGDNGHVFIWAGEAEKEGAAGITGVGALRAGAGLVTLLGEKATLDAVRPRLPLEVMTQPFDGKFGATGKGHVYVFGPGMGTGEARWQTLEAALKTNFPCLLDADALTILSAKASAAQTLLAQRRERNCVTILTPHPKEAARLLGCTVDQVGDDRYAAARALATQWHSTVLLKGKGTVIASPQGPTIVVGAGDSGLSKGGTGDLLSGVIAALLAQGIPEGQAAPLGAYLHGRASELLSQSYGHERSSLATEIAGMLPRALEEAENASRRKKSSAA